MKIEKVREEQLEALIAREDYQIFGTTTVCLLTLGCGFKAVGTSACINPEDFNRELGAQLARAKAFDQLWQLEGYHRMRANETTPAEA